MLFKVGHYFSLASGPTIIGLRWISKTKLESFSDWPNLVVVLIGWLQRVSFEIWIALGTLTTLSWFLKRSGDPWVWDKLQVLLDATQALAYKSLGNHIRDHHRVTLFKYTKWHWFFRSSVDDGWIPWSRGRCPWSGWLIPVLRSGQTSQNTKVAFLASDDGARCEGVAGYTWASNKTTFVNQLPDISSNSPFADVQLYARQTFCPEGMVQNYVSMGRPLPRSIGAIPIEVNHKFWGVLVLDSRHPQGVSNRTLSSLNLMVVSLSQLLEKAK